MNAPLKQLLAAPWANQPVSVFMRILAWILSVLFGVAFIIGVYFGVKEGVSELTPEAIFMILVGLYMELLFIYAARKGKVPSGWLPW